MFKKDLQRQSMIIIDMLYAWCAQTWRKVNSVTLGIIINCARTQTQTQTLRMTRSIVQWPSQGVLSPDSPGLASDLHALIFDEQRK